MKRIVIGLSILMTVCMIGVLFVSKWWMKKEEQDIGQGASLYWQHYGDDAHDTKIHSIVVGNKEEVEYACEGYLIESDCIEGVYAVIEGTDTATWNIVSLCNGKQEMVIDNLRKPVGGRILGYKGGWIYYANCEDDAIGFFRINIEGAVQQYDCKIPLSALPYTDWLDGYPEFFPALEGIDIESIFKTCTISEDGKIALCIFDYNAQDAFYAKNTEIVYIIPDGTKVSLGEGRKPAWLDSNTLLFERDEILYAHDVLENVSLPYATKTGEQISLRLSGLGSITINKAGTHLVYFQRYIESYGFLGCTLSPQAEWDRAVIVSLQDGKTHVIKEVGICYDRYWVLWG